VEWLVERATDAEALAGTDTTRYISPKQLNDISKVEASETVKWIVERATDAEALAGTDTTRYISPKQAKDNYFLLSNWIPFVRNSNTGDGAVNYAHWLGETPKYIQIVTNYFSWNSIFSSSMWFYNWTDQACSYWQEDWTYGTSTTYVSRIHFGRSDWYETGTATFWTTNVVIDWTREGGSWVYWGMIYVFY
jgi:hypothetical protein